MSISEEQVRIIKLNTERALARISNIITWKGTEHVYPYVFGKIYQSEFNSEECKIVTEVFNDIAKCWEEEHRIKKLLGKNYLRDMKTARELSYNLEHRSEMFFDHVV